MSATQLSVKIASTITEYLRIIQRIATATGDAILLFPDTLPLEEGNKKGGVRFGFFRAPPDFWGKERV